MKKSHLIFYWTMRVIPAIIMIQTLYFKFSASAESVYIFSTIGMEPWGRIGIGIMELMASALLLINVTAWFGAALALGLMAGAIGMHLTLLGIEVQGDHGYLFILSVAVCLCSAMVLVMNKINILSFLSRFRAQH